MGAQQKENEAPKALVFSALQYLQIQAQDLQLNNQQHQQLQQAMQKNQYLQIQAQDLKLNNQQHQQLQQALKKLDLQQGIGFTTKVDINLKGGAPKTYNFIMTAGHGHRGM